MDDSLLSFDDFLCREGLGTSDFELIYELYSVAAGGESRGTYKLSVHENGTRVIIGADAEKPLLLVSEKARDAFLHFLRHKFMRKHPDPDVWYGEQIAISNLT